MKRERLPRHLNRFWLLARAMRRIAGFVCLLLLMNTNVFGQYCVGDITLDDDFEYISRVTFQEIDNHSGRSGGNGYNDYTAMEANLTPGETYQIAVSLGDSYASDYVFVFIDWNQNGLLDDPGEVYEVVTNLPERDSGPHTYDITIPENAVSGATRMRVVLQYGESDPNPCITSGDGEVEDYTVIVGTPSACPRPTGLATTAVTTSSADLSWESVGGAFELKWGISGFGLEDGGTLVNGLTATTYSLVGLTEGIPYDVYVRRDCGVDGYSDWTGPLTVTPAPIAMITYTGGHIPTAFDEDPDLNSTNFCEPEPTLTLEIPDGYQLSGLTVQYRMEARNYGYISEQRSMLYSPTLDQGEEHMVFGSGYSEGTYDYERPITFANGATGEVDFVLRAWRTYQGSGNCNTTYNRVVAGSWKLIATFERLATCLPPADLAVTAISRQQATVSWESGEAPGVGYDYYYATTSTPPHAATTPKGSTANTTFDLSGLEMGQTYHVWVRANCGDGDYSNWTGTSFTTSAPWSESFDVEHYYELPAGWQSQSGSWTVDRTEALLDAESYVVNNYFSSGESDFLTTNAIGPVEDGDVFTFIYRNAYYNLPYQAAPAGSFKVTVGVSTDGGESFQDEEDFTTDGASGWQPFTLDMGVYAGQMVQLRIGVETIGAIYSYRFGFDNFYAGPPQCPRPLNLSSSAITPTSATIAWNEPASLPDGGYQYYYAKSATPPTAVTEPSGTASSNSANLIDLSPGEQYYFWVRTVCDEEVYGAWSIAGTFATELELSSPWTEDFEASTSAPPGWGTSHWQVNAESDILNADGNIVYSSLSNSAGNWSKTLTTPNISVAARDVISFSYATKDDFFGGNPAKGRFTVSISEDYGAHYTDIETVTLNSTMTWRMFSYALDSYEGKNIKLRIVAEHVSGGYQVGFDLFRVGPPAGCPVIGTVSATTVGYTGAIVEWEDTGSDYEYYLVDSNTPPSAYTGSYERTSDTEIHFDDLEKGTTYYFWVRAYCSDDSYGEWGPLAMFTTPTQVGTPWAESFPTEGAPQGWEITGWEVGTNSYLSEPDGNAIYKQIYYNFDVAERTFTTLHVGDIQSGDQLSFRYQLTTHSSTPPEAGSGNFTVAIATDIGNPYTDIETVENNGTGGWQEFSYPLDDYVGETIQVRIVATWVVGNYFIAFDDFSVGPDASCAALTGLSVSDITADGAMLAWDEATVVPAGYDYYLATDETMPGAATEPSGSTSLPSVALTDLVPGQTYYWWVRAVCGAETVGVWSAIQSFTTKAVTPRPWLESFSSTATPADWVIDGWSIDNHEDIDGGAGNLLYYNLYSSDPNAQFTTPDVGIIQTGDELSFRFKRVNYNAPESAPGSGTGGFEVKISTDFGEHYEMLATVPNDGTTGWQYRQLDLSDYAGEAIRIQVNATQEDEADYYLAFDDFAVGPPPTCPPIAGVAVSERTTTTATVSWDEPDDAPTDGYGYFISTSSEPPGASVGKVTLQPSVALEDLDPATTYFFWVRANCGDEDYSAWRSISFTTGTIRYVKADGSGDGSSWANASGVLQAMVDASDPGSEVWVAEGTYRPETDTGMPPRGFEMKSGVAIYGGFPSAGGAWNQRDWSANQTVLKRHPFEELPVVSSYDVDPTGILDGFVITDGNASRGGGIYNLDASPTFRNLEIRNNKALWGGGMYADGSSPRLINVAITNNESSYAGAGMSNIDSGSPMMLTNVVISNNKTGNGYNGGAMDNTNASLILTNVTIAGNISSNSAVYNENTTLTIRNSVISGNSDGYNGIDGIRQGGAGNVVTVDYSLVEGLTAIDSRGNIDGNTDPGFIRLGAGDYRLQETSPLINAGSNTYFTPGAEPDLSGINTDVAGNPRFYEGSTIDLGAYEYNGNQPPLPTTIRYVKTASSGGDAVADGRSWETASSNLQAMIDASMEGDEVWVAAGDYHAVYDDRPHITFVLKEGVTVYGGFPANGGDLDQRDWKANETTLIGYSGGGYPVVSNHDLTSQTVLDGFIIQEGDTDRGGGIYNLNASPTLRNLWIKDNQAAWGGGIYNTGASSPEITDVEISNNIVEYSGGGILNGENSNPPLTRVVIRNNEVTALPIEGGSAGGAGIFHQSGGTLKLVEVTVADNTSNSDAGGIYIADESSGLYLENSHILGNTAHRNGGGFYLHRESTDVTLVNTVVGDNQAQWGGGIYNDGHLILLNTTLGANKAANGGGVYHASAGAAAEIENSIVSGNYQTDGTTPDDVYNNGSGEVVRNYSHSLVTGSGGSGAWDEGYGVDGGGNVDAAADFLSLDRAAADYLRLGACSPAIDGGSDEGYENSDHQLALDLDAASNPRLYGSSLDMGAFERQMPPANSVVVPTAGTYRIGQTLTFEVMFSAPVSVTGIPYIPLIIGGHDRQAHYESGSASNTLTFQYQLVEGDEDTEGIEMASAIVLDGGELIYTDNEKDADLTLCGEVEGGTLIDGVKPELTAVSIASDNTADVTLAKPDDEITLTFIADEAIGLPTVTIAGNLATLSASDGEPNSWQASYTMTADDEEGPIAFTIDYEDEAGNAGSTVEATTDESIVTFDKTPPETPTSLAIERADGKLVISWDVNTEVDFALYRLYMGTDLNDLSESIDITDIAADSYIHADLDNGTEYYYRIAAVDEAGNESEWSDRLSEMPKAAQTITFDVLDDKVYGAESFVLSATATSGLTVQFESSDNGVASIGDDGVTVTIHGAGTVTITATQPGNTAFEPAIAAQQELVILKAKPVITWANPTAITYGTALSDTQLNAEADVDGLFTYTPAAGTVPDAGTGHPLTVTFTPDDTDNYEPATASEVIAVQPRSITLTVKAQSKVYGDDEPEGYVYALSDGSALAVADNLGDIVSNITREAGEGVGSYSVFLELAGAKAANYDITFDAKNKAFTIRPKPLTVSLSATPETEKIYDGTAHAELSAGNYRLHGVLGDDDVYVSGSASYKQAEAGENIRVRVEDFVLHGRDAIHYVIETTSAETVGRIVWGAVEAPTNLSATTGDKQVALSWQAPPDNGQPVMEYVIQFSPDNGQTWALANRIPATVTRAVVVDLQNNRPYDFRVAAANDAGIGPFSESVVGIIPTAPVLDDGKLPNPPGGEAVVITNGDVETVTLEVVDSEYLRLSSGDFEFKLATLGVNGNRIPISEIDAIIRMIRGTGTSVYVSGRGFEPGTVITVYVFSDPQVLGHIDVRPDGSFEGSLLLPNNLEIGKHTIQANGIVAGDGGERSVSLGMLVVENKTQNIQFDGLGERSYGQGPMLLNATSTSGLPIVYTVTDPEGKPTALATIEHGNKLHIHGAGDVWVTATQPGNMEYRAAASVARRLHISRAALDVSVADASRAYGEDNPKFELSYSGFVNNDDVSSLTRQPEASSQATSASAPGTYPIGIEGGISGNYLFRYHVGTLAITKAHQVINFNVPHKEINRAIGSVSLDVGATSGLPVTLDVDNTLAATLTGTVLNVHRLGTVQITATQTGDSNYLPADPVTVTVRIVDPSAPLPVRVHQAVSPNGDGINEWLIIEGIRDYPENRVTIINRNGTVLWEANGYDNANVMFRGISTGQMKLPAGTYFYLVEIKNGGKWVYEKGYFVLRY
ncbi:fibronectin type III domain-containing protein [Parapedobacter indicus]|nr:fibronectin type III domain-containing protein [Parapedobacter indicus]